MKYREDGDYSIDNNIAERKVRPFIVDRKNTKTFGHEDGIDCPGTTYHTIIQTCRMTVVKMLNFFRAFSRSTLMAVVTTLRFYPGHYILIK
jgi:transposase